MHNSMAGRLTGSVVRKLPRTVDEVQSEGGDRPGSLQRSSLRYLHGRDAASADFSAAKAPMRWEEGELALDGKQAAATQASLKLAADIAAMEARVDEWQMTRKELLAEVFLCPRRVRTLFTGQQPRRRPLSIAAGN